MGLSNSVNCTSNTASLASKSLNNACPVFFRSQALRGTPVGTNKLYSSVHQRLFFLVLPLSFLKKTHVVVLLLSSFSVALTAIPSTRSPIASQARFSLSCLKLFPISGCSEADYFLIIIVSCTELLLKPLPEC